MFKHTSQKALLGARSYASQAPSQAAKAQSALTSLAQKGSVVSKAVIYYSKVAAELGKYVWLKEGLSPPSVAEFQKTFTSDLRAAFTKAAEQAKHPQQLAARLQGFKSDDYIRAGAIIVQLLGIFSLGEIIGRRHIYGYKSHAHDH